MKSHRHRIFYGAERGKGLKRRPPRTGLNFRLTDADHFSMIRTAQRRFAPTVIAMLRNGVAISWN
jgi:hypothetical protein